MSMAGPSRSQDTTGLDANYSIAWLTYLAVVFVRFTTIWLFFLARTPTSTVRGVRTVPELEVLDPLAHVSLLEITQLNATPAQYLFHGDRYRVSRTYTNSSNAAYGRKHH